VLRDAPAVFEGVEELALQIQRLSDGHLSFLWRNVITGRL
jgi:hypothetical protein